jgi:type IX secretion system PorP/SprF family membrane protein
MRRSVAILFFVIMCGFGVNAQQDAQFTLFPWANYYFNPGSAGEQHNTLCFTGLFRQQYAGYQDAIPNTDSSMSTGGQQILFNMESYLRKLKGGLGLSVIKDKNGQFQNIGLRLGYAYKLNLPSGRLGIGFQVGFLQQSLVEAELRPNQEGDPLIQALVKDPFMNFDVNFGLFYKASNWYAGASATQILTNVRISGDNNFLKNARQMYLHGGYIYAVPFDPAWTIEPNVMLKTDFSVVQFDLLVIARYNNILWGGLHYRIDDAVSVVFGARPFYSDPNPYLKGLDMGLSYSFTTSKLGYKANRSFGDVEFVVRYCFDIFKPVYYSGYGSTRHLYKNQY